MAEREEGSLQPNGSEAGSDVVLKRQAGNDEPGEVVSKGTAARGERKAASKRRLYQGTVDGVRSADPGWPKATAGSKKVQTSRS
jgi:hypothetical protein